MASSKKAPDFEQALEQLEALVEAMESGELSLEESLKTFEQGIKLTRDCQTALTNAEQKVQLLQEQNGQLDSVEFDTQDEDKD